MDSLVSASHQHQHQHQQHSQQQHQQHSQQQQHPAVAGYAAQNQFSMQVDAHAHSHAHAFPPASSSSASSSSSSSLSSSSASAFSASSSRSSASSHFPHSHAQKMSGYEYEYEYEYAQQYHPHPSSHSSHSQQRHPHQQHQSGHGGSPGPALQIQTATPAPHEHEPEEQTAHPSRPGSGPASFAEHLDDSLALSHAHAHANQQQQQTHSHGQSHSQTQGQQQQQSIADALTDNPGPYGGLSRALTLQERELLAHLDRLKFFLATAPSRWNAAAAAGGGGGAPDPVMLANVGLGHFAMGGAGGVHPQLASVSAAAAHLAAASAQIGNPHTAPAGHPHSAHPALNRFLLPNQEYVSCVLWGGLYHITGTDIVRALVFRFEAFGRPVRNMKKFEEGVFSDLRNLKPGVDACLEEPKSPFLDLLFKYQCIRTQKKQKVFYWFSVPHDRLFLDALERDLKREKMGLEPTTVVVGEPALSFTYDPKRSLYEQFSKAHGTREGEGELEAAVRRATDDASASASGGGSGGDAEDSDEGRARSVAASEGEHSASSDADDADDSSSAAGKEKSGGGGGKKKKPSALNGPHSPFFPMFSLFEGSPTYKQRRKKVPKGRKSPPAGGASGAEMSSAAAMGHPGAFGYDGGEFPGVNGGAGGSSGSGGAYAALGGAYREPHLDRFGRDTMRLSASDMFAAGARAEFGANPDLVVSQKERQRRAMDEFAAAAVQGAVQGKLPFLSGLSGPGVAGTSSAASSSQSGGYDMVYGLSGAGDFAAGQQQPQQYGHSQRPHLEQRHTFPIVDFTHPSPHSRALTDPYGLPASVGQPITTGWVPPTAGPSGSSSSSSGLTAGVDLDLEMDMGLGSVGMGMGTLGDAGPRTKAFVCPLFSCGRMFKRMEHLRRHLRTHTLERPFPCDRCPKRFSRSDNLAQHVRTHERREAAAAAAAEMNSAMGMNVGMGMAVGVPDGADADAEDELEDDIEGYLPGVGGITSVQMCEVEVRGQVHEVQGDEEGLLTTTGAVSLTGAATSASDGAAERGQAQSIFYDNTGNMLRASPETSPYLTATSQQQHSPDSQWATIPSSLPHHSSPPASAFSTASGLHLSHAARLDASYHTTGGLGEYVTSISAPSHKLTFDHATLYPSELPLGAGGNGNGTTSGPPLSSTGLGPIRRHRSATPSIPRYGESIRRPFSAALSDSGNGNGGSPGQGAAPTSAASTRSYHPYAVPGHHQPASSRSAQSSPMAYTVPLGYEGAPARVHGHSRSSSSGNPSGQLQEQMRQMLSLDQMEAESMAAAQYASAVYRTDSPMSYSDMAHHQQSAYGLAEAQYAAQQQQSSSEYFAQPHPHHSL